MPEFLQWTVVDLDQNMIGFSDVIIFFGLAKTLPQSFSLSCLKPQLNRLELLFLAARGFNPCVFIPAR